MYIDNEDYWQTRKRPGEEIMRTGFVMEEGFQKTVALLSVIAKHFEEAVFSGRDFRFELRYDQDAHRTFWCFFDATDCAGDKLVDPEVPFE